MTGNPLKGAARALIALAALAAPYLIDVVLMGPSPSQSPWTVQALVEERPAIPDHLALRGRATIAALRAQTRDALNIAAAVVARFVQSFLGAFA